MNLKQEQRQDPLLQNVKKLFQDEELPISNIYAYITEQKYIKHFPRLHILEGVLYKGHFGHDGNFLCNQVRVAQHLKKEILNRIKLTDRWTFEHHKNYC